ncbi:hypothetical protein EV368DRAFT_87921 [Lentinula lateritia]|nr:hypothetical protein EV368DRAFT_87921 [Lentinula lateritia]
MQFIEDVNHDIHVAQNAWNEAVEYWQQSVIDLLSSTEEKHKALSRLTTETDKLINHLNSFTEDYRLTVTSLLQEQTSVHSSSSARNIAQNAKAIRILIIHSSRLQDELLEDLPLRRALIRKLETVYTKRISAPKGNFLKEDLLQAFLLAGRCRDVLKAVDSSFKRSGIVVRPSTHSASMCDQVSEALALSRTSRYQLVTDIPKLGLCLRKYDRKDQDRFQRRSSRDEDISACLSGFQCGDHTLDDMQSMFTNIKRRSFAMVFDIIEQFREDEQRISMEIKGTYDRLQAHQESHQEQLDVLKDCAENMIERLDLKLNDFKEEFNKSTADGHLQYGQGNTTEYIGNLWTIALRFLPVHGTEDVGEIQRGVTDELQRLGDRVVAECFAVKDLRIHSSFMTSIYNSTTQSGDSKSNSLSKNISTLLNQDLETIAETPECETEVKTDCSIPHSEDPPSNSLAGELAHLDLVHAAFCDLELEAKTTFSRSERDDAAGRDIQDRRSHFFTGPSDTSSSWISFNSYSLSVSFALAIIDLVQSCSSALVSLKLRVKWPMPTLPVFKYTWDGLQLSSIIRISGTDLLAVAMGKVVEIRSRRDRNDSSNNPHWELLKTLPAPPIGRYLPIGAIVSIHAMSRDRILISYENGVAVRESLWTIVHSDVLDFEHEDTMLIPGVINDVCPGKGTVLVTVAGTYQIFVLGSETAQNIFVPCDPLSKTPQTVSCTKFISEDLVIGAGVGQLVLWNAALGNRLQNLVFCNQDTSVPCGISSAYKSEEDSGWIVSVHKVPDRYEIAFWTTADLQEDATESESHDDSQCRTC